MPSPNKHTALKSRKFALARTCSTCVHWTPAEGHWGRCSQTTYQHEKHSGERQAGTPDVGTCPGHAYDLRSLELAVGYDYVTRYAHE